MTRLTSAGKPVNFADVLPRLITAYEGGELVPFLGAGMSSPACPLWEVFVERLERRAGITDRAPAERDETAGPGAVLANDGPAPRRRSAIDPDALVRRADHAVRILKLSDPGELVSAVTDVLIDPASAPPEQTQALAKIWWPLVVTTNYDGHFFSAFADRYHPPLVRGRSVQDCRDVLSSLGAASDAVLWAVQGFLTSGLTSEALGPEVLRRELERELVIGHEEYRRVTHRAEHSRKAFAEVYRRRSFLFLGAGLAGDSYLLELFGEILELLGPNPHVHYALAQRDTLDTEFFLARLNIIVVEYGTHGEVPELLGVLRKGLEDGRARQRSWGFTFSRRSDDSIEPVHRSVDLSFIHGELPLPEKDSAECVAISGGSYQSDSGPKLSGAIYALVQRARDSGRIDTTSPEPVDRLQYVWRYGDSALFCIAARGEGMKRDVRVISEAVEESAVRSRESTSLLAYNSSPRAEASRDRADSV